MADVVLATNDQGTLSEDGANTNCAFEFPTYVGDIVYLDIIPPTGKTHPNFLIPGIPDAKLALSVDGVAEAVEGADLEISLFAVTKRIWIQWVSPWEESAQDEHRLILSPAGFEEADTVVGSVDSESSLTGDINQVIPISGEVITPVSISGDLSVGGEVPNAEGDVIASSNVDGDIHVVTPVSGSTDTTATAEGDTIPVEGETTTRYYFTSLSQVSTTPPSRTYIYTKEELGSFRLYPMRTYNEANIALTPLFSSEGLTEGGHIGTITGTAPDLCRRFSCLDPWSATTNFPTNPEGLPFTMSYDVEIWYDEDDDITGTDLYIGPNTWIEY